VEAIAFGFDEADVSLVGSSIWQMRMNVLAQLGGWQLPTDNHVGLLELLGSEMLLPLEYMTGTPFGVAYLVKNEAAYEEYEEEERPRHC